MKKYKKYILLIIFLLIISFSGIAGADSGWDSSYDSSSSSSSSSDSSDSSDSSSSSGGGIHFDLGLDENLTVVLMITIFIVVGFCFIKVSSKSLSLVTLSHEKRNFKRSISSYNVENIQEIIPDFNREDFCDLVFDIYKNIQIAWMNFDYDTLRRYTTDELYNMYYSQLLVLSTQKQKNIMDGFKLHDFEIVSMEHDNTIVSLKVRVMIECYDYVIDENNEVVRGSKDIKNLYDYEMTFIRGIDLKDNKCPNCGVELDNSQSSVCPYCHSTIINENHYWILSKKQMIRQKKI